MVRVILIGCGNWAAVSHLAALSKFKDRIKLEHVADLAKQEEAVKERLRENEFNTAGINFLKIDQSRLVSEQLPKNRNNIDACIIATGNTSHLQYLQWSLSLGLPTLVDKPLTFHPEASTNVEKALQIAQDYCDLLKIAKDKGNPLFILATQKRYLRPFQEIARKISMVYEKTGYPVTSVNCFTSDGYWLLPHQYLKHSYTFGGGKLIHTGYHFFDIVPWLMRHAAPALQSITHAWVTTNLFRPIDSVSIMPAKDVKRRMFPEYSQKPDNPPDGYGDINANVSVKFCDQKGRQRSTVNYSLLHEGFSLKEPQEIDELTAGRTKIDYLTVSQGPVFYAEYRRIAKIIKREGSGINLGEPNHYELTFLANEALTGLPKMEHFTPESDSVWMEREENQFPAMDFFKALLGEIASNKVLSPVEDHVIGIKLLSAAYHSAAKSFKFRNGMPVPVRVDFDELDWRMPPISYCPAPFSFPQSPEISHALCQQ